MYVLLVPCLTIILSDAWLFALIKIKSTKEKLDETGKAERQEAIKALKGPLNV